MTHRFIAALFSVVLLLSSCNIFPGFFLPWANQNAGIGSSDWSPVGASDFSPSVAADGNLNYFLTWDMAVNQAGDVMVGLINESDFYPYVYEYHPQGSWQVLGNTPVAALAGTPYTISVAYASDGINQVPYCAYALDNGSTNILFYAFDLTNSSWPGSVNQYPDRSQVDLMKDNGISSGGPAFVIRDSTTISAYTDLFTFFQSSVDVYSPSFFEGSWNKDSQIFAVASGDAGNMGITGIGSTGGFSWASSNLTSLWSPQVGVEIAMTPPNPHALTVYYIDNMLYISRMDSNNTIILNEIASPFCQGLDTAYDNDTQVLYIAVIGEANRPVTVYRYFETLNQIGQVGSSIDIQARTVKIETRPGSDELYLGIMDWSEGNRIKVYKIRD